MKDEKLIKEARKIARPFCITDGKKFRLKSVSPNYADRFTKEDKKRGKELLAECVLHIGELQEQLFVNGQFGVLIMLQGMDACGKDSIIRAVLEAVNPQGCIVHSFKEPSREELAHNFQFRIERCAPRRGFITVHNRGINEEVLVVRVHPELLVKQGIPEHLITDRIWDDRFEDIRAFERRQVKNGFVVLKFMPHVSKAKQKERLLERFSMPAKYFKASIRDVQERKLWKGYMWAYEEMVRNTATKHAPWYVVPADRKWFAKLVVACAIIERLSGIGLSYPKMDAKSKKLLEATRQVLMRKGA